MLGHHHQKRGRLFIWPGLFLRSALDKINSSIEQMLFIRDLTARIIFERRYIKADIIEVLFAKFKSTCAAIQTELLIMPLQDSSGDYH
jgi:hypothetical protein